METLVASNLQGMPGVDLQNLMGWLARYFLVSIRMAAFFLAAPFFGARYISPSIRIVLAMVVAMFVFPRVDVPTAELIISGYGLMMILAELVFGVGCGLIIYIWFTAAALAGEKIATSAGLGFATQMDPNSSGQTPVVSQVLTLFLTVIFLSLNGHLVVIGMMLESYNHLPIGAMGDISVLIDGGIAAAGYMFLTATMIMLPVVTLLLMINITIGIITRSAPQLNLFSFGFPISLLGVFVILFLSTSNLGYSLSDLVQEILNHFESIMEGVNG